MRVSSQSVEGLLLNCRLLIVFTNGEGDKEGALFIRALIPFMRTLLS